MGAYRKEALRGALSLLSLLVLWIYFFEDVDAQGETRYLFGQPIKTFEVIEKEVFCEDRMLTLLDMTTPPLPHPLMYFLFLVESQCSRMNENYLKFYFSVFITIAWGGAVRTVIKTFQLSIPYTVVLLITGLVLGLGSHINPEFCETWAMFTKFARTPPELILYVFLPLLIFESAFSMNSHVFMTNIYGVSVQLFLMGLSI